MKNQGLRRFTKNDVDLCFQKICGAKKKNIDFEQFKQLCHLVADKKKCPIRQVQDAISNSAGPVFQGTKADAVRLHDDKTTYTGTHTDNPNHGIGIAGETESQRHARLAAASRTHDVGPEADWSPAEDAFRRFDPSGNGLDTTEFVKAMLDSGLYTKAAKPDIEVIFAGIKGGRRKIGFEEFKEGLRRVASQKGMPIAEVQSIVANAERALNGTEADYVRFHDDKDTYTGTHAGK